MIITVIFGIYFYFSLVRFLDRTHPITNFSKSATNSPPYVEINAKNFPFVIGLESRSDWYGIMDPSIF